MGRASANTVRDARNAMNLHAISRRHQDATSELEPVIASICSHLPQTVSKTTAAAIIGISVPTLNKWIDRRILDVTQRRGHHPAVRLDSVMQVAERVESLRKANVDRNLIGHLTLDIARDDPEHNAEFEELYGKNLRDLRAGKLDLVSGAPPEDFGPDD